MMTVNRRTCIEKFLLRGLRMLVFIEEVVFVGVVHYILGVEVERSTGCIGSITGSGRAGKASI